MLIVVCYCLTKFNAKIISKILNKMEHKKLLMVGNFRTH